MFIATPEKDAGLRVPLCCIVDYKGFRAQVIAHIELETSVGPKLGFLANYVINRNNEAIYQSLRNIGIVLNLKENRHQANQY